MSGIFAQLGVATEVPTAAVPAVTAGAGTAGVPNLATLTFASPHALRVGDVITVAGATPTTWNGTWTVTVVPSTTTATFTSGTVLLASTTVQPTVTATAWGNTTTPSRFFEFNSETIKPVYARIESKSLRASNRVLRSDRFAVNLTGAGGDIMVEMLSKGFGIWLSHMFGTVTTTGPTDSAYTHTGTIGATRGRGLTVQVGRPDNTQVVHPFTYNGCKVTGWSFDCAVDGLAMLKITVDGQAESLIVPLAVASYATGAELMSFIGGSVTVAGVAVANIKQVTVTCTNNYAADRRFIATSALQQEQLENGERSYAVSMVAEFTDLTTYARYTSANAAGALAALTITLKAPTLIGATTYPSFVLTMPNWRCDGDTPVVNGPNLLTYNLIGPALNGASLQDACQAAYTTLDTLP